MNDEQLAKIRKAFIVAGGAANLNDALRAALSAAALTPEPDPPWTEAEPPSVHARAAEMLTAYAELVKMTGKYAEAHYIPAIEHVIERLAEPSANPAVTSSGAEPKTFVHPDGKLLEPSSIGKHGVDCPKVRHIGNGHLHAADDDSPYEVDGCRYCGRCHSFIGV